ncbi:PilN domain-containing protein [Thermosulfidibacter takaii]|nr:PilN domain-containing protein [Thermosulfidibacter takaii]
MDKTKKEEKKPKKPPSPSKFSLDRQKIIIIVALILGVLVSLALDYSLLKSKKQLQVVLKKKKKELAILEKRKKIAEAIKKELVDLEKKEKIIKQIIKEAHLPLKVLLTIQKSMPNEVWLDKLNLDNKRIKITGYALNDEVLAAFVERLMEKKDLVVSVRVSRYEKVTVNKVPVKKFVGEVIIK